MAAFEHLTFWTFLFCHISHTEQGNFGGRQIGLGQFVSERFRISWADFWTRF